MKHVLAVLFIVLVLWIIYGSGPRLNYRSIINFSTPLTVSDISSILSTVIAVVSLLVALWSISIAVQQLKDARDGSQEQSAILKKQQESLDRSRDALEAANNTALKQQSILNNNLAVSVKQLDILNKQWSEQQDRLSKKPYFEFRYRFGYAVTETKVKTSSGIMSISGGLMSENSDWYIEDHTDKNPYIIKLSNTFPVPEGYDGKGKFQIEIDVRNIGSAIANNVHVVVTPLVYGLHMSNGSVSASGAMVDVKMNPLYYPADIKRDQLPIFQDTQEHLIIPFDVVFLGQELGKVIPIRIEAYSDNIPKRTIQMKFKIIEK